MPEDADAVDAAELAGAPLAFAAIDEELGRAISRERLETRARRTGDARAEGERVVGAEARVARPERGAARLVERVRVRIRAVALCGARVSVCALSGRSRPQRAPRRGGKGSCGAH